MKGIVRTCLLVGSISFCTTIDAFCMSFSFGAPYYGPCEPYTGYFDPFFYDTYYPEFNDPFWYPRYYGYWDNWGYTNCDQDYSQQCVKNRSCRSGKSRRSAR